MIKDNFELNILALAETGARGTGPITAVLARFNLL